MMAIVQMAMIDTGDHPLRVEGMSSQRSEGTLATTRVTCVTKNNLGSNLMVTPNLGCPDGGFVEGVSGLSEYGSRCAARYRRGCHRGGRHGGRRVLVIVVIRLHVTPGLMALLAAPHKL